MQRKFLYNDHLQNCGTGPQNQIVNDGWNHNNTWSSVKESRTWFIYFFFGPDEEGLLAPNRWNGNVYDADIHITLISAVLKLNLAYVDKFIYEHLEKK